MAFPQVLMFCALLNPKYKLFRVKVQNSKASIDLAWPARARVSLVPNNNYLELHHLTQCICISITSEKNLRKVIHVVLS